jgi:hypothetical protein
MPCRVVPESCQSNNDAMLHRTDMLRHFTLEVVPMVKLEERERERETQRDEMVSAFGIERQNWRRHGGCHHCFTKTQALEGYNINIGALHSRDLCASHHCINCSPSHVAADQ